LQEPIGSVTIGGKTISVYKDADVSDADANATLTSTQSATGSILLATATYIATNVTRIEIGGTGIALDEGVLRIQSGVTNAMAIAANLDAIYGNSLE
jgi:hypothetical protein